MPLLYRLLLLIPMAATGCTVLFSPTSAADIAATAGPDASALPPEEDSSKKVFITSDSWSGNFAQGSSDARATTNLHRSVAAGEAGLEGIFAAWLSLDEDGALSTIQSAGPWSLVGTSDIVFESHDRLTRNPEYAINRSEYGLEVAPSKVRTGTLNGGDAAEEPCSNWRVDYYICPEGDCYYTALVGRSDKKNEEWTESQTIECNEKARLYCFEVDRL